MAIGWLTALKALPWGTILSQAPTVVDAANRLLSQTRRKGSEVAATAPFDSLQARIEALEEHDRADAALMKQLAEEVAELARASEVIALRMRLLLILTITAIVVALIAIALVVLR